MFDAAELAGMRAAQESGMMDRGQVFTYAAGALDDYGNPSAPTYTAGIVLACGLDNLAGRGSSSREVMAGTAVVMLDARLRLPIGTAIKSADRVRITSRFGEALAETVTYDVIGDPMQGPSGLQVNLKAVAP